MGPIDLLFHLCGFVAPALAVAALVAFAARWLARARPALRAWALWFAVNSAVGVVVLIGGLLFFQRDGRMATYAALVLACASSQWLLLRRSCSRRK